MSSLKYEGNVDRMTVTLASGYTAASGTMSLTAGHGARLPSSGDFWIVTTTGTYRAFKVTARSTDTLTVTAAQDGTSDGNLDAGTELAWSLTKSALDQLRADLAQTGPDASFSAEKAGNLYLPSNGVYLRRDTGAAGVPWGPLFPLTEPVNGDFSWINQGPATLVTTQGGVYMHVPTGSPNDFHIRKKSAPSVPYVITAAFLGMLPRQDYNSWGLVFRESSSGKFSNIGLGWDGSVLALSTQKMNSPTSYSGEYDQAWFAMAPSVLFLRIEDDNSNRKYYYSADGQNWLQTHSVGRTDFITADEVGWYADEGGSYEYGVTLLSWAET